MPQTKNPTNVGLDVVERVNLFQQYHLFRLPKLSCFNGIIGCQADERPDDDTNELDFNY